MTDYANILGLDYAPSTYQTAIFDFVTQGRGNGVVEAVAGSGKTTTIVCAARLIAGDGLFVAFNKSIATELGSRLRGTSMAAKTIHAVGFAAIRFANKGKRVDVVGTKYRDIVRNFERDAKLSRKMNGRPLSAEEQNALRESNWRFPAAVFKLLDLARLNLVDFESPRSADLLWDLAEHHAMDIPEGLEELIIEAVLTAAKIGKAITHEIDFADMVWLPVVHGYRPKTYSWVFVDECQDLSACQLALIMKCVRRGGRMLCVGDRRQAIYGFAGADARSFEAIIDKTNARVLPLSVCYRCPTTVLDAARLYCPQIEAAPGAAEGNVDTIAREELTSMVVEGDMILSRINAPLVATCFELIADGIAATVRGRDIGKGLSAIVDKADKMVPTFERFTEGLSEWLSKQLAIIAKRCDDDAMVEQQSAGVRDQVECVRIILGRSNAQSAEELKAAIAQLFSDEVTSVVLSSIHKAKGLEAPRVFILETTPIPSKRTWMQQQESNLHYVARTRAMASLYYVEAD